MFALAYAEGWRMRNTTFGFDERVKQLVEHDELNKAHWNTWLVKSRVNAYEMAGAVVAPESNCLPTRPRSLAPGHRRGIAELLAKVELENTVSDIGEVVLSLRSTSNSGPRSHEFPELVVRPRAKSIAQRARYQPARQRLHDLRGCVTENRVQLYVGACAALLFTNTRQEALRSSILDPNSVTESEAEGLLRVVLEQVSHEHTTL